LEEPHTWRNLTPVGSKPEYSIVVCQADAVDCTGLLAIGYRSTMIGSPSHYLVMVMQRTSTEVTKSSLGNLEGVFCQ
jgi:hypothetical protein